MRSLDTECLRIVGESGTALPTKKKALTFSALCVYQVLSSVYHVIYFCLFYYGTTESQMLHKT